MISILNQNGQLVENLIVPGTPEISCIQFSKMHNSSLFICDNSYSVYKIHVMAEEKKDKDKN